MRNKDYRQTLLEDPAYLIIALTNEYFVVIVCLCICVSMCVCTSFFPAMESHGECEIKVQLNCSHCQTQSCKRDEDTHLVLCLCDDEEVLASDNVTCIGALGTE